MKIKSFLTYEGIKWPVDHGLFTAKGVEWLGSLKFESVDSYLRIMCIFDEEIRVLSRQLEGLAREDEDVKFVDDCSGGGLLFCVACEERDRRC